MKALLGKLHARLGDFWCHLKLPCASNGEILSCPIPKELETIYMTDNQTTVADFIRSRPAASAPYLIAAALTCRQYKYPVNSCELHCTARALRYNRAELQIAARAIRYGL